MDVAYTRRWVRERDSARFRRWVLVSSNHLGLRSVWKSLVASCVCVCVAQVRTRVFDVFVSSAKRVRLQLSLQLDSAFVFYLEIGLETPEKRTETREKSFCKTWFEVGMEPEKVQKQGRDERTQEDYPTSGVYFCRCRVVFLRSFISALFLYFFRLHPYFKSSFTETFFS